MKDKRYDDMEAVRTVVNIATAETSGYYGPSLNDSCFGLMNKRLGSPTVRSYFAVKMYEYIVDLAKEEGIHLKKKDRELYVKKFPFVIEGLMTILYHFNQIWDNKNDLDSIKSLDVHIGGNILRSSLHKYIYENIDEEHRCDVMFQVIEYGIHYVDIGQYIDKFGNNYDSFKQKKSGKNKIQNKEAVLDQEIEAFIDLEPVNHIIDEILRELPQKKDFIELYFKRLYLISSSLFKIVALFLMNSLGYYGKQREAIIKFSECYGLMMQVVNDTADFVPERGTVSKQLNDAFSDLKNYNITLPLIFHLSHPRKHCIIDQFLETGAIDLLNHKDEVLSEIVESSALLKAMKVGRDIADQAKKYVLEEIPSGSYLLDMLEIAFNNRYYHHIYKAKKCIKQGKKYHIAENYSFLKTNSLGNDEEKRA